MQVFSSNLGKRAPVHRVLQPALSVRARQTSCGAARKRRVTVTPEEEELTCEILVDEGSRVFSVSLAKPLGLVLEEDKDGFIIVEDVVAGGNASKLTTALQPGDRIKAVTARNLGEKESRVEIPVFGKGRSKSGIFGESVIISTDGQSFDTVMAAISSNRCLSCDVHLVVERPTGQAGLRV